MTLAAKYVHHRKCITMTDHLRTARRVSFTIAKASCNAAVQESRQKCMQVNVMTSFNSASFPDSLAIAKESGLTIGSIDEIQKLHIRAVPMGEQARRLAHQDSSHTFLVTTSSEPSSMTLRPCCFMSFR